MSNPEDYFRAFFRSPYEHLQREFDRVEQMIFNPYWRQIAHRNHLSIGNGIGEVVNDESRFAVSVDVSHFRPNELTVNVNGREVTVEGKHEERNDAYGSISRCFVRKYILPDDVNADAVASTLTDQGMLSMEAPKVGAIGGSRTIPIQTIRESI